MVLFEVLLFGFIVVLWTLGVFVHLMGPYSRAGDDS